MRVLQIGMGNVAGGLEAFVMNYYRILVNKGVQFDFVCMYDKIAYEEEIQRLGGRIFYIPNVKKNYNGYVRELRRILREQKYTTIHVNMLSAANIVPLRIAHQMGVKKIIAHSHSSSCPGLFRKTMNICNRPWIAHYANELAACGDIAGKWMFGERAFRSGKVTIINNAVQTERFLFSAEKRKMLREEMGWENKFVIGHVGRFDIPKNHSRMIDILKSVTCLHRETVLCLVGPKEGLYGQILEKTKKEGLENNVYFAGKQEDICRYLSAMDVFLFPSVFEGVPFALIEAQTNGLACVMSDAVSEEAVVFPDRVRRLSLEESDSVWAENVKEAGRLKRPETTVIKEKLTQAHFNIEVEAGRLKKLYQDEEF